MSKPPAKNGITTAVGRWKSLGPYYAMFPVNFAFDVVAEHSKPGDAVLDPFAGRGSSIYAAVASDRSGCGIEINPVGWLYGRVKLQPASKINVLKRVKEISQIANNIDSAVLASLPIFFPCCYAPPVLRYLLAVRATLDWRRSIVDATLMALILVFLHGKQPGSLSNQMRQGKAMAPDYSVRWWQQRGMKPPEIDPVEFLVERVEWRYSKGVPPLREGKMVLGDSTIALNNVARRIADRRQQEFKLLFTSPPYYSVTNYYKDQWLRLWLLGGSDRPIKTEGKHRGGFSSKIAYQSLLKMVFGKCAEIMSKDAVAYVRTDARAFTYQSTIDALKIAFPKKQMEIIQKPFGKKTQTALYGDKEQKPGEYDIILRN